ncbi:MAG: GAF domain-containing protein, partial [Anaerolineales bacterium]|nr:GAF domain-containing protein [Anaerolineales bacterium]
ISMPDETTQTLKIQASVGVLHMDEGVNGRALRTGQTQLFPEPDSPHTWTTPYTILTVPLRHGRQPLGVFNIEIDRPNGFSKDDILLAESLAEAIVLALDNARLYTEMQQRLHEQMVLQRASSLIASTLDLPTLLSTLAEQMGQIIDVTSVYICRYDVEKVTGTVVAEYFSEQALPQERVSDLDLTYSIADVLPGTADLLEAGQPKTLFVSELNLSQESSSYRRNLQAQSILLIPLQVSGQTIAYAELWESRQPREFTPDEISLCQAIAQQAAIALEQARLFHAVSQEQSRLQALIEADREGIVMVGTDGRILVMNSPVLSFLHLPGQPADWIGRSLYGALSQLRQQAPAVIRTVVAEMKRVRVGHEPAGEGEFEIDGKAVNWRNLPVMDGKKPLGRLLVLRDVTEERLLERMRDDLMHTMVHDLRGPLTSIAVSLHLLDLLTSELNDERSRSTLLRAHKSMETVMELVNAILDISRLESGRMVLNLEALSLSRLAADLLDWQLPLLNDKNLNLELAIPDDLPQVRGDNELLNRVLQNLLGNAIKFTPEGGTIGLKATHIPETMHVQVIVSDTGSGIPAEIKDRIFQKFTKGGQEESGSGLGLYFCKMVIEAHGERIWVGESVGQGTAVHFTLPVAQNPY